MPAAGAFGIGAGAVGRGPVAQPASVATITSPTSHRSPVFMGLILLEALGALVLLVVIVWWTMFAGRRRGEIADPPAPDTPAGPAAAPPPAGRDPSLPGD